MALALVLASWFIPGCSDIDLYYQAADPSPLATDRPADRADAVPDQPVADGLDVPVVDDGQPLPDVLPDALPDATPDQLMMDEQPVDVISDDGPSVDVPDGSDQPTDQDAGDVPSELADVPDATVPDDAPDAPDAPPDHLDEDRVDVPVDGIPPPDALADAPDALGDAPADAEPIDSPDADVGSDVASDPMSDPPAPPELIITYATTRGPTVIPADQDASRIDYSFGDGVSIACTTSRLVAPLWRCTVPTVPPVALLTSALYFAVPGACGIGTGRSCDGWPTLWSVTWRGRSYDADTIVTTDAGREPALRLADRTECTARMGYNNICVRLTVQP